MAFADGARYDVEFDAEVAYLGKELCETPMFGI